MYNNNIKRQETVGNSESKQVEYSGVFKTRNELKIQAISSIFLLHKNINDHFPFNVLTTHNNLQWPQEFCTRWGSSLEFLKK